MREPVFVYVVKTGGLQLSARDRMASRTLALQLVNGAGPSVLVAALNDAASTEAKLLLTGLMPPLAGPYWEPGLACGTWISTPERWVDQLAREHPDRAIIFITDDPRRVICAFREDLLLEDTPTPDFGEEPLRPFEAAVLMVDHTNTIRQLRAIRRSD